MRTFKREEKVVYYGTVYDFGYYTINDGDAVIYEEGCCNMQDALVVDTEKLTIFEQKAEACTCCPVHGD